MPTLVLHRRDDRLIPVENGRYLAEHIPDGKFVELAGVDHVPWWGDTDAIIGEIEEFLTGARGTPHPERALLTVLFTDIVGSTAKAAELGDREWNRLLERHNAIVDQQLRRFRGQLVKLIGDGVLAVFDGPTRALRCATAIRDELGSIGIDIRAGVHTGECERHNEDFGGIAVHIASRIMRAADRAEVLASRTVRDLIVGSGLSLVDRGCFNLKGVPGEWELYAVAGPRCSSQQSAFH